MRRILLYIALLAAALVIPVERTDLGKLKPVETVYLYTDEGILTLLTDIGDKGTGKTVGQALENLKQTTAGTVYLDTAEYLLITEESKYEAQELKKLLKGSVRICEAEGEIPLEEVGAYLSVHLPEMRLSHWKPERKLQILKANQDRFTLE